MSEWMLACMNNQNPQERTGKKYQKQWKGFRDSANIIQR